MTVGPSNQSPFNENVYQKQDCKIASPLNTLPEGSTLPLPAEILCEIFSKLDPTTLGLSSGVCRQWKRLARDPTVMTKVLSKDVDFQKVAIGSSKFAKCFEKGVINDIDNAE